MSVPRCRRDLLHLRPRHVDLKLATVLQAEFVKLTDPKGGSFRRVATLAEADGVLFLCPKCYAARGSHPGVHSVLCWFRGRVPDGISPKPGRWTPAGTGLHDLTFVAGAPPMACSVLLTAGCRWHGFVRNGGAQ